MDDYPDLSHLVDLEPLPASGQLQEIVRRHHRRRSRQLAAGLAVMAVVGPALGFAVARGTDRQTSRVVAASQPSAAASTAAAAAMDELNMSVAYAGSGDVSRVSGKIALLTTPPAAARIFLRTTADGIRIRAYTEDVKVPAPPAVPLPACFARPVLLGEVSDDLAVGQAGGLVFGDLPAANPVAVLSINVVGVLEQSPMWTVTLRTAPNVAKVVAHFSDGTSDQMSPQQGWAILAHHTSAAALKHLKGAGSVDANFGTLEAFDSAGRSLASGPLSGLGEKPPAECLTKVPVPAGVGPSTKPLGDEMKPVTTVK